MRDSPTFHPVELQFCLQSPFVPHAAMPSAGAAAAATCGAGGGADVAALVGSLGWTLLSASLSNPAAAGGVGVFVSPVSVFYALMLALNAAGKQGACTGRHCIIGHACSLGFSSFHAVPQPSLQATLNIYTFTHPSAKCQCHQQPSASHSDTKTPAALHHPLAFAGPDSLTQREMLQLLSGNHNSTPACTSPAGATLSESQLNTQLSELMHSLSSEPSALNPTAGNQQPGQGHGEGGTPSIMLIANGIFTRSSVKEDYAAAMASLFNVRG